ncbi:MAG: putative metal-dependent hydrolase [Actinomycetia bacterium]|nr:putative metal-dependent hydrolase [Actinomycetes bacterium]
MTDVGLAGVDIVDAHTHPYRLEDLLAKESEGFDTRMMFLGESFHSSSRVHDDLWPVADGFTDSTVFGIALRRWLAAHLDCEPSRDAVTRARDAALRADPVAYTKGLLDAAGVVAILSDEGFPQPPILAEEFASTIGATVHRVTRLEPWILHHRDGSFDDLVAGVEAEATQAAADPNCLAYKSIVAYRTGLDVGDPSSSDAEAGFARWRDDGWAETREHAKPVRDFLIRRALAIAKANDRPFHFHCGGGDPDINLAYAGPASIFPLLVDVQDQPVVLVHSGYPWVREAAYVASVLPNVYLELSELIPWGWGQVEWALEMLVGTVPAAKLLYGSDEAGEPEAFWASALLVRSTLERVLGRFVERDYVSTDEAERLGRLVLGDACRRLHGFGTT